jgi:hypothetical protein
MLQVNSYQDIGVEGIRDEYGVYKEIVGIEISNTSTLLAQAISKRIEENLVSLNLK